MLINNALYRSPRFIVRTIYDQGTRRWPKDLRVDHGPIATLDRSRIHNCWSAQRESE